MALTLTNRKNIGMIRPCFVNTADCAFDSSYAFGGESLTPANFGWSRFERVTADVKGGYTFEYDYTNSKLKAFSPAPPIVFEESVTVTTNVGTLKYPHAAVMYVSSGNTPYRAIAGGYVPVTGTVAVSTPVWGTRGTLTFLAGDSVTSCKVTYITQAWKEMFDNLVQCKITAGTRVTGHASATFTAGTPDVIDLGEAACFIESVTWDANGTYTACKPLYKGETAQTTEFALDWANSTNTTLSPVTTDNMNAASNSVIINYIRKPAAGFLYDRFIEEDDLTPGSHIVTVSSGLVVGSNMLTIGTCGQFPSTPTTGASLISSSGSVGSTATLVTPTTVMNAANTFTFGSGASDSVHVKLSYICGQPHEIATVLLEVPNAEDLSTVLAAVKLTVTGY